MFMQNHPQQPFASMSVPNIASELTKNQQLHEQARDTFVFVFMFTRSLNIDSIDRFGQISCSSSGSYFPISVCIDWDDIVHVELALPLGGTENR
jgi:hypothetical protein